eukprot:Plantae.Rhodophyta-Purpureofilum_apyrenoidigerum.ctg23369.p2 GENE.Plantae.Rhodophyta-Purpureofilum_apyrenoidigerum.ctg23369~~Plantae.Rhodophyta-Purpureofilum_apyrenoidigerum.ctg23369.p2  ORF type:complete len:142 (+),score=18.57 Plantae.Rhodophyta-Purpureofilum_apyrenoidigerum.ctg23369:977-1402(+)
MDKETKIIISLSIILLASVAWPIYRMTRHRRRQARLMNLRRMRRMAQTTDSHIPPPSIFVVEIEGKDIGEKVVLGSDLSCPICMEELESGTTVSRLGCGHEFCSSCVQIWGKRAGTCPVCREDMYDQATLRQTPITRENLV